MELTRLRIVGFKTFVEPTEVSIEPGLTGIVGPNGCGKSNLVDALRWVLGESSHKTMRASGMDDLIFSGSAGRASRNTAEVCLSLDNTRRSAPSAFSAEDELQVTRRIERGHGSRYEVNGREVHARDVQLLFADATTGARSPSIVRQGRIAELIAATPQARRRILEDAAGLGGLGVRRHEAELRLAQADDNLQRVEAVLREIGQQVDGLRRQDEQAVRYRAVSADLRATEAALAAIGYIDAQRELTADKARAAAAGDVVTRVTAELTEAAANQVAAARAVDVLRQAESDEAGALDRAASACAELEGEERRVEQRLGELRRRIVDLERDADRQTSVQDDAFATLARIRAETAELTDNEGGVATRRTALTAEAEMAERELAGAELALASSQAALADMKARRSALEATLLAERERVRRLAAERTALDGDVATLVSAIGREPDVDALRTEIATTEERWRDREERIVAAREAVAAARDSEARQRRRVEEADRAAQRLETELQTLAHLFAPETRAWPTMLDCVKAKPGYAIALGAALGDDLAGSPDQDAPVHWIETGSPGSDLALPGLIRSLAEEVEAPPALRRRLRQIGIVEAGEGAKLAAFLGPGQRLVSREGDLWRWDGFTIAAEASSRAARRLVEANRLTALDSETTAGLEHALVQRNALDRAEADVAAALLQGTELVREATALRHALNDMRDTLSRRERADRDRIGRRAALAEAISRVEAAASEADQRVQTLEADLGQLDSLDGLAGALADAQRDLATKRAAFASVQADVTGSARERGDAAGRRCALARDLALWADQASATALEFRARLVILRREHDELSTMPDTFAARRVALASALAAAELRRAEAAARLVAGEQAVQAADHRAGAALDALSAVREDRALSDARWEASRTRFETLGRVIADMFETSPARLIAEAGLVGSTTIPDKAAVSGKAAKLRRERDALGAVNLRAADEFAETMGKYESLAAERDDVKGAIRLLRHGLTTLDREGRERLDAAFGVVNAHFKRLFTTLFGGGSAELTLLESKDPLEAGLEITATPPGRIPQRLSLLSGGEQALAATALIFAVFLTNPSPICVLDEVDAPLDDANVERFCRLLRSMAGETATRFLVVTHNPITMAEMDRLIGVTMQEQGVSQLVTVDLQGAERLREAG